MVHEICLSAIFLDEICSCQNQQSSRNKTAGIVYTKQQKYKKWQGLFPDKATWLLILSDIKP